MGKHGPQHFSRYVQSYDVGINRRITFDRRILADVSDIASDGWHSRRNSLYFPVLELLRKIRQSKYHIYTGFGKAVKSVFDNDWIRKSVVIKI